MAMKEVYYSKTTCIMMYEIFYYEDIIYNKKLSVIKYGRLLPIEKCKLLPY